MNAAAKLEALLVRVQANRQKPRALASVPALLSPAPTPTPALVAPPTPAADLAADFTADAVTPPRGLRTPLPQSPPIHAADATPRHTRPTPLEMAVFSEAEHESRARDDGHAPVPLEAKRVAPTSVLPPSIPIARITSEPSAPERSTFGGLLQRTLALRPR